MITIIFWMFCALFGSSQSASFECQYIYGTWGGTLGTLYYCSVKNSAYIITPDAAQIDNISGTHLTGYNFENVDGFAVPQGQMHYFPRGLNKFFENLKGITIRETGLKEIHQSDLKDFPKLLNLHLYNSNLEILEENLFEFNPNLELIYLISNKISHINSNVFDKLIKLKGLYFNSNTCIDMSANNNPTGVQNVIRTAQLQCTILNYSKLEQKVKYLEMQSTFLNLEDLNENLKNLETEIKNSNFSNFFREKLKELNAVVIQKERDDVQDIKLSGIEEMLKRIIEMMNKNNEDFNTGITI